MKQQYVVSIYYRSSGCWLYNQEPVETFESESAARERADNLEYEGDYGRGEYRAIVTDGDESEVYRTEWKVDPSQDVFETSKWLVKEAGEYSTEYYGIGQDGEYLHTIQNGGLRGSQSRQEGDGRWGEMFDEVEEVDLSTLLAAIMHKDSVDVLDAATTISDVHPSESLEDILLAVAERWDWTDDEKRHVLDWIIKKNPVYGDEIKQKLGIVESS